MHSGCHSAVKAMTDTLHEYFTETKSLELVLKFMTLDP
jgi:hypothetical protein